MVYSDFYLRPRHKFSALLVGLSLISMLSFGLFFFGSRGTVTRASKRTVNQQIVNLSTSQLGIYWESTAPEVGWIVYGADKNVTKTAYDVRDVAGDKHAVRNHFVPLKDLDRDTTYYYKIVSGSDFIAASNGVPFTVRTAKIQPAAGSLKPAYGKVARANGEAVENGFVFYSVPNATPLVTMTKSTGEWLIPLSFVVTPAGDPIAVTENDTVTIKIFSESDAGVSKINALVKKTNPFTQTIILGKNYDLTQDEKVLSASTQTSSSEATKVIDIVIPKENAIIPAVKPLFKGVGIVGKQVSLRINSTPAFSDTVTIDKNGEWRKEVPIAIPAGSYTLKVTTQDEKGKTVTVTRSFSIAKSGEQVLGEATESATTPSPTVATPTPVTATATPTIAATGLPNTGKTPTPPVTGFSANPILLGSFALILAGIGFLIVF